MPTSPPRTALRTPLDRAEFPVTQTWTYCDHAAVGPLPRVTRDILVRALDAQMNEGTQGILDIEARKVDIRKRVAASIGALPEEIAFMRATSDGALLVSLGLEWKPGDEIIFSDDEFGANAYPWFNLRAAGVRTKLVRAPGVRLTVETLERMRTPRTRLVAVSYVAFSDGYRHDIPALGRWCRDNGILFAVDAMQGFGPLPLDVGAWNVDFCYFGVAKWLLSPQGLSVVYVRRERVERLRPAVFSWRSVQDPMRFFDYAQELDPTAARFEGGTIAYATLLGFGASLNLLASAGFENIQRHVLELNDRIRARAQAAGLDVLSSPDPRARSGIVLLGLGRQDYLEVKERAAAERVAVTIRPNGARISPHGYNTEADVDRVIDVLARELR